MPCSCALRAACSAASCAANGVDLREPLKPHAPADDQEITFPDTSVMVTIVLLKVELMCATPVWTFFLTLRFACRFGCAIPGPLYFLVAAPCFLTAWRRGPFRVRGQRTHTNARTGSPRR